MSNLFDSLQDTAFGIVTNTMGYSASWTPSSSAELITGPILFKNATETAKILDVPYNPKRCLMEYHVGVFNQLKPLVDVGSEETVSINGIDYGVMQVTSKYDGKTFYAELQIL